MRRTIFLALAGALALLVPLTAGAAKQAPIKRTYVVLYERGTPVRAAHAAIKRAGGRIVHENRKVGVATVRSANARFVAAVARSRAVYGAARNRSIGYAPAQRARVRDRFAVERMTALRKSAAGNGRVVRQAAPSQAAEPFADLQWDMRMIHATAPRLVRAPAGQPRRARRHHRHGHRRSHPDIAPNFDRALSRNFTDATSRTSTGPVRHRRPASTRRTWTTTVTARTWPARSPRRSTGSAWPGVAPKVELVNIRAGQDSGYFFLQPSVDALTYAGDHGVDVVNMSYYIDPWLYNCADNPADSPDAAGGAAHDHRGDQRALGYAHNHGVTLVSAEGNGNTDLGKPVIDDTSPDYPPDDARTSATIDNSCESEPLEAPGVTRDHLGRAQRRARPTTPTTAWSRPTSSAPGGDRRDFFGTTGTTRRPTPCWRLPEGAGDRQRRAEPGRHAQHAVRARRLLERRLRLLPVPAGHLDGVAARRGGGGPGRGRARPATTGPTAG